MMLRMEDFPVKCILLRGYYIYIYIMVEGAGSGLQYAPAQRRAPK